MKKNVFLLCALIFTVIFISCGKQGDVTGMQKYDEPKTEAEQVQQSESDQDYYTRAKAENDSTLCEKIAFTDLKKLCLKKTEQPNPVTAN